MTLQKIKSSLYLTAILAGIYIIMLFRWGYEFGRNDQMQVLSYAKYICDHSLYPQDQYIQGVAAKVPNERFVFSWLLSLFSGNLEIVSLLLHIIFALVLLRGLYGIAEIFIRSEALRWLALLVLLVPLYGINLGGNELYYSAFFVSNVVKAAGVWGVYLLLRDRFVAAFIIFSVATFFQPIVGIQLYITCSGILFLCLFFKRCKISWKPFLLGNLLYLVTAGVWMYLLKTNFEGDKSIDDSFFFNVLFVFRSPHHYWPASFPLKNYLILVPLFIFATLYFYRRDFKLFLFFIISIIACMVYTLAVQVFHSNNAGALQWFKITIWLKAFGVIALIAALDNFGGFLNRVFWKRLCRIGFFSVAALCLAAMLIIPEKIPFNVYRDYGAQYKNDPAIDIAVKAKELTPKDAWFIHPLRFTELKYYGERSSYVDYKILVHTKVEMMKWHDRIRELYGIGYGVSKPDEDIDAIAGQYYNTLSEEKIKEFAKKGIGYMITARSRQLTFPVIAENEKYRVYKLN